MPNGCTSRTRQLSSAGSLRVSEPLAFETTQRIRNIWTVRKNSLDFRGPVGRARPRVSKPVVASERAPPALQCRTPSRHHLELQDRRDYTPADEQPDMLVRLSRAPTISGGLRRKNSAFY
ncbi:hypothetical protein TNCV_2503861 [Trichonephila clavipes]|nr:hypothetical protein TNCV_2503861 [Trichonephila clavipes]